MKQIQFQILEEAMDTLKAAAKKLGVTPQIVARLILHECLIPQDTGSNTLNITSWIKNGGEK